MLRVDYEKWGQSISDLRDLAMNAGHARTRERFMALYEIADGRKNATVWASENRRHFQSVQSWVHAYNNAGADALIFRHTGGWLPFFARKRAS